jgi:TRAP-type C4-dicarboxylate transport system substrate-binding protein
MPSRIIDEQFRQLSAKAVATNFNETYRSLENGSVNSQENTISNMYSKKFYEVQKYITLSNHGYLGYGVLMNKAYWESIPAPLQKNIMKAMENFLCIKKRFPS